MAQTATMQAPAQSQQAEGASSNQFSYPQAMKASDWDGSQNQGSSPSSSSNQTALANAAASRDGGAAPDDATRQTASKQEELFPNAKKAWFSYYHDHRNQVVFASVGLLVAAGFLTIGFWPTLLLAVFITAGVLYGRYKDGDRKMVATVQGIISKLD